MSRITLFALATSVAVIGTAFVPIAAVSAGPPGTNGKIVFESERDGNFEIYSMNPDGSAEQRLTKNSADDFNPVWSPDGNKIAFGSERDGNGEIYVMNADGSGQKRLTNNPAWDYDPTWSPDGGKIAFETERHASSCPPNPENWRCNEIYVMNPDGSAQTRLTNNTSGDYDPLWSPDGTKILHESERDGNFEVYVMNADGTAQTNLSNNPSDDFDPLWSPDGTKILYETYRGNNEIYLMNANGSSQTNLSNNAADDYLADCCYPRQSWAPNGTKIAFGSDRDGNQEIYSMSANGTGVTRLTNNDKHDWDPSWSPDSATILFESERDGNFELYSMDADGSSLARLTSNKDGDYDGDWGTSPPSPETKMTSRPRARTRDRTPTFKFEADMSGARFECKLDATPFKPCSSPKTYGKLGLGKHKFNVKAVSADGVKDPTPAKASWTITKKPAK